MSRKILLSFDIEEFDMPLEYKYNISPMQQISIGKLGLDQIMPILDDSSIQCTLFTTANFASHYKKEIKQLSQKHEIASHTYFHSTYKKEDLLHSKIVLNEITQKEITGLRMPRMKFVPIEDVKEAGYEYDASINPTFLPGRYNNLHLPRTIYQEGNIKRIPASVSPNFRIPLFWLSFKNFPYKIFEMIALQTLKRDGYLSLYFHPWEFIDISKYGLPKYTTKGCNGDLLNDLSRLINKLKNEAEFITMKEFALQN